MKESINFTRFVDLFNDMDRGENFTYEGKRALFEYLEQYEEDTGQEVELDIIALCCDYTEATPEEIRVEYDIPEEEEVVEYVNEQTCVIAELPSTIIYQHF